MHKDKKEKWAEVRNEGPRRGGVMDRDGLSLTVRSVVASVLLLDGADEWGWVDWIGG